MINYKAMSILIPETPRTKHWDYGTDRSSRRGGSEDENTEGSNLEMGGAPQSIRRRKGGREGGSFPFSVKHKIQQRGALRGGSRERHSGRRSTGGGVTCPRPVPLTHTRAALVLWYESHCAVNIWRVTPSDLSLSHQHLSFVCDLIKPTMFIS